MVKETMAAFNQLATFFASLCNYISAHQLVIYFIYLSVLQSSPSFAASLGGSGCNENCYESVDHFCKLLFGTLYMCMKCKLVCANVDSQSDRDECNEHCQDSQYFPKLPSTPHAIVTPNTSTIKLPAIWTETLDEVTSLTTNDTTTIPGEIVRHESDSNYRHFFGVALMAFPALLFFIWLCNRCISSHNKTKPFESTPADAEDIPMQEISVQEGGGAVYQTSRPPIESVAISPSDEQQEDVPHSLRKNQAQKRGTAEWVVTSNPAFQPEDEDNAKSAMALSVDTSKALPAKVQEDS